MWLIFKLLLVLGLLDLARASMITNNFKRIITPEYSGWRFMEARVKLDTSSGLYAYANNATVEPESGYFFTNCTHKNYQVECDILYEPFYFYSTVYQKTCNGVKFELQHDPGSPRADNVVVNEMELSILNNTVIYLSFLVNNKKIEHRYVRINDCSHYSLGPVPEEEYWRYTSYEVEEDEYEPYFLVNDSATPKVSICWSGVCKDRLQELGFQDHGFQVDLRKTHIKTTLANERWIEPYRPDNQSLILVSGTVFPMTRKNSTRDIYFSFHVVRLNYLEKERVEDGPRFSIVSASPVECKIWDMPSNELTVKSRLKTTFYENEDYLNIMFACEQGEDWVRFVTTNITKKSFPDFWPSS